MIDSVKIVVYSYDCGVQNMIEHIATTTNNFNLSNDNLRLYTELQNLKLYSQVDKLVIGGSLCKFYLGDNIQTLTRIDIDKAITNISDILKLDIGLGQVTRIDIASNIITDKPTLNYLPYLGRLGKLKREQVNSTLYYQRNNFVLSIYDKIQECKTKKVNIPYCYDGQNITRIETRFINRIKAQLGYITASQLSEKGLFNELVNRWRNKYNNIEKLKATDMNENLNFCIKREFIKLCVFREIERNGGIMKAFTDITEKQKCGELSKKQVYDLKQLIKQVYTENEIKHHTQESELITELNKKVNDYADSILVY